MNIDYSSWIQVFRGISRSTDVRTLVTDSIPRSPLGNSAPEIDYKNGRAIASALVLANMNSLPLIGLPVFLWVVPT